MKKYSKIIALILALMLMLSALAACGGNEEPSESAGTDAPSASETQAPSEEPEETSSSVESSEPTESETEPSSESFKAPQTADEILAAYNDAVKNGAPACKSMTQKVTTGTLGIGEKKINLMDEKEAEFRKVFEQDKTGGVKLPSLNAADVSNAEISGTKAVFTLKNTSASALGTSAKGYVNLIDDVRTKELVDAVKNMANVDGVKIKSTAYVLSDGKLTVTFSSDFTKIVSAEFTAVQDVDAKMSYLFFTIDADLTYKLTSLYK